MVTGHVFIATSLDGFIARPDGGLEWLLRAAPEGEDHGYEAFLASVDGIVMGRGTFDWLRSYGGPWPHPKPVVVLSRTLRPGDLPPELAGRVEVSAEAPRALLGRLGAGGWRRVCVDGGAVVRAFLTEGLVEDLVVTRVPVLIGEGRPLFGGVEARLSHEGTRAFPSGLVQSRYRVERGA